MSDDEENNDTLNKEASHLPPHLDTLSRELYKKQNFSKMTLPKPSYRTRKVNTPRFIIWPFIVILPMFFIGFILNTMAKPNTPELMKANEELSLIKGEIQTIFSKLDHELPERIQNTILESAPLFLKDVSKVLKLTDSDLLLLVDKTHILDPNHEPQDLVSLSQYDDYLILNKKSLKLREIIIPALIQMTREATEANITLDISSSYRSYEYQGMVFNRINQELGVEEAERQSARPGTSQHQLGTTIDFGTIDESFSTTEAGLWLSEHAWKYGFSQSYPPNQEPLTGYIFESWHYRYLGVPATILEQTYFEGLQQYMLEFINAIPNESIFHR